MQPDADADTSPSAGPAGAAPPLRSYNCRICGLPKKGHVCTSDAGVATADAAAPMAPSKQAKAKAPTRAAPKVPAAKKAKAVPSSSSAKAADVAATPTHDAAGIRRVASTLAAGLRSRFPSTHGNGAPHNYSLEGKIMVDIARVQTSTRHSRRFGSAKPPTEEKMVKVLMARDALEAALEQLLTKPSEAAYLRLSSDVAKTALVASFFNPQQVNANRRAAALLAPHLTDKGRRLYVSHGVTSKQRAAMRSHDKAIAEAAEKQVRLGCGVPKAVQLRLLSAVPAERAAAEADAKRIRYMPKAVQRGLLSAVPAERAAAEAEAKRIATMKAATATANASAKAEQKRKAHPTKKRAGYDEDRRLKRAKTMAAAAASGNPKPFVCPECGAGYANNDSLTKHVKKRH